MWAKAVNTNWVSPGLWLCGYALFGSGGWRRWRRQLAQGVPCPGPSRFRRCFFSLGLQTERVPETKIMVRLLDLFQWFLDLLHNIFR